MRQISLISRRWPFGVGVKIRGCPEIPREGFVGSVQYQARARKRSGPAVNKNRRQYNQQNDREQYPHPRFLTRFISRFSLYGSYPVSVN
jgi:hypothetical protein